MQASYIILTYINLCLYIYIYIYIYICISYIPGAGALPDIYARLPEGARRPRASAYISGKARGPGI